MKNKLKNLGLAGLFAIYSLAGGFMLYEIFNSSGKEETDDKKMERLHLQALKKYTPLAKEQKDSLFKDLNSGLREFINKVYIVDDKDFFIGDEKIGGHVHRLNDNMLCFSKNYFTNVFLFHEPAHIRHNSLNNLNSDFSERFEEIANLEYEKQIVKYLNNSKMESAQTAFNTFNQYLPKKGLLKPYLATNVYEDVGQFVESLGYNQTPEQVKEEIEKIKLIEYSIGFKDNYVKIESLLFPLFFADTTDSRYKQKLDLLKEYNFLTNEEHEKLSKNLGSLNYLLNEEK